MLIIDKPRIISTNTGVRVQAEFEVNGKTDVLWYEVNERYKVYLTDERLDAFLVGLLPMAVKEGYDIQVNFSISERLFYTLNKYLIPIVADLFKCNIINIYCSSLCSNKIGGFDAIGTGLSCGIDSFSTIYDHIENNCSKGYQITHLTFFNVGSHGSHGGDRANALFKKRMQLVKQCADELGKDLVIINSNLSDLLKMGFPEMHTIRNMSAVLALQKLFKAYYYSSSVHLKDFEINPNFMGYYDVFNLNMLSTENVDLFSSCSTLTRIDKTRMITDYKPAQRYLNVCIRDEVNCGKCFKCLRTLLTLDVLGEIDKFSAIFNMDEYQHRKSRYIISIIARHQDDIFMRELYDEMRHSAFKIPKLLIVIGKMKLLQLKITKMITGLYNGKSRGGG